jgi:hypothetical protein
MFYNVSPHSLVNIVFWGLAAEGRRRKAYFCQQHKYYYPQTYVCCFLFEEKHRVLFRGGGAHVIKY